MQAAGAAIDNFTAATIAGPHGIAAGSDGALWFVNLNNNSIGRISTAGAVTNFTDPSISAPVGIAAGPDGALWFTNFGNASIGRITTDGSVTSFTDPSISNPTFITSGPGHTMWFTNEDTNSIGRITTDGIPTISNYTDPTIDAPGNLTTGPDGAIWFTNQSNDSIGRITTGAIPTIANFTDPSIAHPNAIVSGSDGALWFTNGLTDSIGRITTDGVVTNNFPGSGIAGTDQIAAGPDGALYFTSTYSNSISRITTAGVITNYTDPSISAPNGIVAGSDGALWFTNPANDSIGRFSAAAVPASSPPVSAGITEPDDAAWSVPITNPSGVVVSGVTATLHANANGSTPLGFDGALMPGCAPSGGNAEVCTIADLPAHTTAHLNVYVSTVGLALGASITGDITINANGQPDTHGLLGTVSVTAVPCGTECLIVIATRGHPVASDTGPLTQEHRSKSVVTLPAGSAGGSDVVITFRTISPDSELSAADKLLCPTTGNRCSGPISVISGDFSQYVDRANPIRVQLFTLWKTAVGAGSIVMAKDSGGPPVQLARCVVTAGKYNTPCAKPEVVTGSAAKHNLTTTSTILFVGTDPRFARHVTNGPDAPVAVKAKAAKGGATVSWKPPVVTNGKITGYTITPHLGKKSLKAVSVSAALLKATITGLAKGKSYTFTMVAKTARGVSLASKASNTVKVG